MQENIRNQLIKQFPSNVISLIDSSNEPYYACPVCHRPVSFKQDKCSACSQVLSWEKFDQENISKGLKKGVVEFDLPFDFVPGNCRKCPLSYIGRSGTENVYECPLNYKNACKLKVIEE